MAERCVEGRVQRQRGQGAKDGYEIRSLGEPRPRVLGRRELQVRSLQTSENGPAAPKNGGEVSADDGRRPVSGQSVSLAASRIQTVSASQRTSKAGLT